MPKIDLTPFILTSDRISTFGTYFKLESTSKYYLKQGLEQFSLMWSAVTEAYNKMNKTLAKASNDGQDVSEERTAMDKKYYEIFEIFCTFSGKLEDRIAGLASEPDESTVTHKSANSSNLKLPSSTMEHASTSSSNVKLPPCDIEPFKGDFLSWPGFRDLFTAIYSNNSRLVPVEKLYHLLQKTKGEAHEIVKRAPLTNDGFVLAWSYLTKAYENKRVLTNIQLDSFFQLQTVESENSTLLKNLITGIDSVLDCLKLLGISVDNWDPLVVYHCCRRLPDATLALWEQALENKTEIPTWKSLSDFLNTRCLALDSIASTRKSISVTTSQKAPHKSVKSHTTNLANSKKTYEYKCSLCPSSYHRLWQCDKFKSMLPAQRLNLAKTQHCCLNCLNRGHMLNTCSSQKRCSSCHKKHHSLLHLSSDLNPSNAVFTPCETTSTTNPSREMLVNDSSHQFVTAPADGTILTHFTSNDTAVSTSTLLGTAMVLIEHCGTTYPTRALIDPASEVSFIANTFFKRLQLPWRRANVQISGVSGHTSSASSKICSFQIRSPVDPSVNLSCDAYVLPNITSNLPSCSIDNLHISSLELSPLADIHFNISAPIDILIGSDLYPNIMLSGVKHNLLGSLIGQRTVFGWVLTGNLATSHVQSMTTTIRTLDKVDNQLRAFWEIEEIPARRHLSSADLFCENLYRSTTYRNSEGRYVVSLPFKEKQPALGSSRSMALAQFLRNETRLLRNPQFHESYSAVIQEYLSLNHMHMVSGPAFNDHFLTSSDSCYYLPHHPVIKPESTTTSLRVVFNASFRTSNGVSLNDTLHPGPILQADLTLLLIRWRLHRYVFCSDITKMYRQILIDPNQTCFQRILFRENPSVPIEDYELKTVTFGVNCAPFLAIRTLLQLAEESFSSHPLASKLLKTSLYVDDVLAGYHDVESALQARDELIHLLSTAGFSLHKWMANCPALLNGIDVKDILNEDFLVLEEASSSKTLGVRWNGVRDDFFFAISSFQIQDSYTKREILSIIAKLFDPAGWLAPLIVTAKILMQQIWLEGVNWDEAPSSTFLSRWVDFINCLGMINNIRIPRWTGMETKSRVQIHGFCDASEKAYAGAIYLRCEQSGCLSTHLLLAKTRVAPIKTVSLPRLELCGALLLAKMLHTLLADLKWKNKEIFCWTDSTIVLAWLQKPPCTWTTFVANRVADIQSFCGIECWRHVNSADNPADLGSRGTTNPDFVYSKLWWCGPSWLSLTQDQWPTSESISNDTNLEKKPLRVHLAVRTPQIDDIIARFSCYARALRVLVYVFRFANLMKKTSSVQLSSLDISTARNIIIGLLQQQYFTVEYSKLSSKAAINNNSSLLTLCPSLDNSGLMRVNGRLINSSALSPNERSPIILPYSCHFSKLLVKFIHKITLHGGNRLVLRILRQEFWIPRATNLISYIINRCKVCIIWRNKSRQQIMAALPPERCTLVRPFHDTGVDFAGPYEIKNFTGRACLITKGYICIFVCFATKAIHLEATSNLSSDCFLAAFARFVSRRGCPHKMFSDNGTVFVGAAKALQKEFQLTLRVSANQIVNQYAHCNVTWKFIPPGAPHMGGLWEAGVKSFKTHFRKIVQGHRLTFEEISTVLCRIEACLNSRPLTVQSSNAPDVAVLTPGHFLVGTSLLAPAELQYDEQSLSLTNRWMKLKAFSHVICSRWKEEYLKELHKRFKWKHPKKNIELDDIVVVRSENLPPTEWRLGRITKVFPGADQRVRIAEIRTSNGTIMRPIVKLVPLEADL